MAEVEMSSLTNSRPPVVKSELKINPQVRNEIRKDIKSMGNVGRRQIKSEARSHITASVSLLDEIKLAPTALYYLVCIAASVAAGVLVLYVYQRYLWPYLLRPIVAILRFFFSIMNFLIHIGEHNKKCTTAPASSGEFGGMQMPTSNDPSAGININTPGTQVTIAPPPRQTHNCQTSSNCTTASGHLSKVKGSITSIQNSTVMQNTLANKLNVITDNAYTVIGMFLAIVTVLLVFLGIMFCASYFIEIWPSLMYVGFYGLPMIFVGFMFLIGYVKSARTVTCCAEQQYTGPFKKFVGFLYTNLKKFGSGGPHIYTTTTFLGRTIYIPNENAFDVTQGGPPVVYAWVTLALMALVGVLLLIMWGVVQYYLLKLRSMKVVYS